MEKVLTLVPSSDLLRTLDCLKWQESFPLFIVKHFLLQVSLYYTVMGQGPWEISVWVGHRENVSPFCLHQRGGDRAAEGTSNSLKVGFWKLPDWGRHPFTGKVFHPISWGQKHLGLGPFWTLPHASRFLANYACPLQETRKHKYQVFLSSVSHFRKL